jgi:DNA-binding HxlR family transcriptional regulator
MIPLAELPGRPCPIAATLEIVGDRWALLVVREVALGSHRFTDIAAGTGAPRDRLTARLKALVEAGILERRRYSEAPPRSEYHLTDAGSALLPVLDQLLVWGRTWAVAPDDPDLKRHRTVFAPQADQEA